MKKDLGIIFGLFLVIVGLLVFGRGITSLSVVEPQQATGSTTIVRNDYTQVSSGNLSVKAKIAEKADERKKGLSKMKELPLDEGMLFVFEAPGVYSFWMKDMNFPIDIIWIDENKRIVSISPYATPEPKKPDNQLTMFKPDGPVKYVLEINAGLAQRNGLLPGASVNFEL